MDISSLRGVGAKTMTYLNELGINTIDDLISYYPFRFNVIKKSDSKEIRSGNEITLVGVVESEPTLFKYGKTKDRMTFRLVSDDNIFNITIFNRGFLKKGIYIGKKITVIGKYDLKNSSIIASDIKLFDIGNKEYIEPIYHSSANISSKQISKIISAALKTGIKIDDKLPLYIKNKYNLTNRSVAVSEVHNPTSLRTLNPAINYLKYEELFLFLEKINILKEKNKKLIGNDRDVPKKEVLEFVSSLPFALTDDQKKVVYEIYEDMISKKVMNRLLQGDVGSGKTIVAFISLFINFKSKYQGALMAPTDVLARQHYNNIKNIFKNYNVNIELLTGKMSNKEKNLIKEKLENGEIDIIVGTHALFSKDVAYKKLGLVITDEQHRFGVRQRANLRKKGKNPDVLYMSATPIPRTFALTLYGDMDVSSIKQKPQDRKEVETFVKNSNQIKDVLSKMLNELSNKHQIYVVVPLIEESAKSDMKNVYEISENIKKAFKNKFKLGLLHGKMTSLEKEKVMEDFYKNNIQILVSTTVIEVGLDNKNATVMVVFDSDRFGLSTLHQLRGRVGRSHLKSYFFMICDEDKERLEVLTQTNDGFLISEYDFNERGSGDLFGVRQSGDVEFKIANIKRDLKLLQRVDVDVKEYFENV